MCHYDSIVRAKLATLLVSHFCAFRIPGSSGLTFDSGVAHLVKKWTALRNAHHSAGPALTVKTRAMRA
jgi:hypothetical protein